jgi:pimeloyl-ACP methyl ester carboxylesterase
MSPVSEEVVHFGQQGQQVGVLTQPATPSDAPTYIFCNAGIVHRVGPHRFYVEFARHLAASGFPVFRIDLSGIGDSPLRNEPIPYLEMAIAELREAMDCLESRFGVRRFVLSGLCSGAQFAFLAASQDERAVGVVPINAALHLHDPGDEELTEHMQRRTLSRHYWRIALRSSFWRKNLRKALTQQLNVGARLRVMLRSLGLSGRNTASKSNATPTDHAHRVLDDMRSRDVRVLHVYSEGDEWLDYFELVIGDAARSWPSDGPMRIEVIEGADHTFTLRWSQRRLLRLIDDWNRQQGWVDPSTTTRNPDPGD